MTLTKIIEYELVWVKVDPDGRKCASCKEHIWGATYELRLKTKEVNYTSTTTMDISMCEPCFQK